MDYLKNPTFVRQLIMDHYEHPRNKREEPDYPHHHVAIDSCIDDITVQVKIENNRIVDLAFIGQACTIATSSTSIMTELLMGKSLEEADRIIKNYNQMIHLEDFDEELVGEAIVFSNVGRQANRINCATLGWRGVEYLIEESRESHD